MNSVQLLTNKCNSFSKKLFNSPGIGTYSMIMSTLSGYPIGAKVVGDLHSNQLICDADAKKMITYSMTSGPAFIIGTIGIGLFNNINIGILLFITHILAKCKKRHLKGVFFFW